MQYHLRKNLRMYLKIWLKMGHSFVLSFHKKCWILGPLMSEIAFLTTVPQLYFKTCFKIWSNPGLFFVYFRPFHITIQLQIEKSLDGVLGIWTRGRRMVGADETTELWQTPSSRLVGNNLFDASTNLMLH